MVKSKKGDALVSKRSLKELTQTRVIIRRLPRAVTVEELKERLQGAPDHDFLYFCESDRSLDPFAFCRAYINLKRPEDAERLREYLDGQLWKDSTGRQHPVVVEFAPYQRLARRTRKKPDPKMGSLEDDPDYVAFLKTLEVESEPPVSLETLAEEEEAKAKEEEELKKNTPLIEFMRQRHTTRQATSRGASSAAGKADKHAAASTKSAARVPAGRSSASTSKDKKSESGGGKPAKDTSSGRSQPKDDYYGAASSEKVKSGIRPSTGKGSNSDSSRKSSQSDRHQSEPPMARKESEKSPAQGRHASEPRGKRSGGGGSSEDVEASKGRGGHSKRGIGKASMSAAAAGSDSGSRDPSRAKEPRSEKPRGRGGRRGYHSSGVERDDFSSGSSSSEHTPKRGGSTGGEVGGYDDGGHGRGGHQASRGSGKSRDSSGRKGPSRGETAAAESREGGHDYADGEKPDSRRGRKLHGPRNVSAGSRHSSCGASESAARADVAVSVESGTSQRKVLVREAQEGQAASAASTSTATTDAASVGKEHQGRKKRPTQQIYQPRARIQDRGSGAGSRSHRDGAASHDSASGGGGDARKSQAGGRREPREPKDNS